MNNNKDCPVGQLTSAIRAIIVAIVEVDPYTGVVGGAIGVHQHPLPPSPGQDSSSYSSLVRTSEGQKSFCQFFQTDIFRLQLPLNVYIGERRYNKNQVPSGFLVDFPHHPLRAHNNWNCESIPFHVSKKFFRYKNNPWETHSLQFQVESWPFPKRYSCQVFNSALHIQYTYM